MSAAIHPGQWRLEHIELANWGTFSGLHSVQVPRKGFLLTGESGSGKSSLVDAISAVLTPRGKTRFNAAAADTGTRGSDRSVLTYVRGAWRRSADGETGEITSQYLRPKATWSGILLRYANGRGQRHTLVKLFHLKAGENTPADVKDLSLLTGASLSLADLEPFAANGLKMRELKAAFPDATVDAEHSRFARRIARTLGLTGERAALLLHKTQSAKNLGSLDELFRKFMLDEPETFAKADAAVDQFTELNAAHAAVLRARRQVEHLSPLRDQDRDYAAASTQAERTSLLLESLDDYTHARRRELTVQAINEAERLAEKRERELREASEALHSAREHSENYRAAVAQQGGAQLALIEAQLDAARRDLNRVQADSTDLERKLGSVDLAMPADAAQYAELVRECTRLLEGNSSEQQQLELQASAAAEDVLKAREAHTEIERDMQALRSSRSNLPRDLLAARAMICQDTGLSPDTLRFAGELLQVEASHAEWTGAIERVLRPLALVMLVPSAHTLAVSRAVNARHLNASLKFETIGPQAPAQRRPSAQNSLVYRVQVATSPMHDWLQARLAERYDYACVNDADQLAQVARGVTLAGQVKRGPTSFEKNDKRRVDDRRHWVLGFDTDAKLEQLQLDISSPQRRCWNAASAPIPRPRHNWRCWPSAASWPKTSSACPGSTSTWRASSGGSRTLKAAGPNCWPTTGICAPRSTSWSSRWGAKRAPIPRTRRPKKPSSVPKAGSKTCARHLNAWMSCRPPRCRHPSRPRCARSSKRSKPSAPPRTSPSRPMPARRRAPCPSPRTSCAIAWPSCTSRCSRPSPRSSTPGRKPLRTWPNPWRTAPATCACSARWKPTGFPNSRTASSKCCGPRRNRTSPRCAK